VVSGVTESLLLLTRPRLDGVGMTRLSRAQGSSKSTLITSSDRLQWMVKQELVTDDVFFHITRWKSFKGPYLKAVHGHLSDTFQEHESDDSAKCEVSIVQSDFCQISQRI
jgi:hypothetical protein